MTLRVIYIVSAAVLGLACHPHPKRVSEPLVEEAAANAADETEEPAGGVTGQSTKPAAANAADETEEPAGGVTGQSTKPADFDYPARQVQRANDLFQVAAEGLARARALCEGGNAAACVSAGLSMYFGSDGEPAVRTSSAGKLFRHGCSLGNVSACTHWGRFLRNGTGVTMDRVAANKIFANSCELGDMVACHMFGLSLMHGDAIKADPESGVALVRLSCNLNVVEACRDLGETLIVSKNRKIYSAGIDYLDQGCEKGDKQSCAFLGAAYSGLAEGYEHIPSNQTKSKHYLTKGCDLGDASSCALLGFAGR